MTKGKLIALALGMVATVIGAALSTYAPELRKNLCAQPTPAALDALDAGVK